MRILFAVQLLAGMILVLLSPALESVLRTLEVGERGGGTLYFAYFTGTVLSTLSLSWLTRLLSSRGILQLCCVLEAASLWGFSCSRTLFQAGVCYFLLGAMNAVLVALPGAILAHQEGAKSGKAITLLYTFFAVGVMLCPSGAGMMLARGIPWQWLYQGMAGLCLLYAFWSFGFRLPTLEGSSELTWGSLREAGIGDRGLLAGTLILTLLYVGAETSVIGWAVYYLQQVFPGETDVFRASRVLSFFWLAVICGRLLTALILDRLGSYRTLSFLIAGGAAVWSCALAARGLVASEFLFALTGFFFSGIFPIVTSYAGRFPRRYTSLVFSVIVAAGGVGGGVVPYLVGAVAECRGIRVALAGSVSCLVLMLITLCWLKSRGARV